MKASLTRPVKSSFAYTTSLLPFSLMTVLSADSVSFSFFADSVSFSFFTGSTSGAFSALGTVVSDGFISELAVLSVD